MLINPQGLFAILFWGITLNVKQSGKLGRVEPVGSDAGSKGPERDTLGTVLIGNVKHVMKASDIMTTDIVTVRGSTTVAEAVQLMKDKKTRALIVERRESDDAYGIVTETDVTYKVVAFGLDPKAMRVYEIMSKPCIVVNPDLCVEYIARLFANTGIHFAPVIKDTLLGTVSVSDILTKGAILWNAPAACCSKIRFKRPLRKLVPLVLRRDRDRLNVLRLGMWWKNCKRKQHIRKQSVCIRLPLRNIARTTPMLLKLGSMIPN